MKFFFNMMFIKFLCFSMIFFTFALKFLNFKKIYFLEWNLINLQSTEIIMILLFDWMSLMFTSFIFFISSLVIFYSKEYMNFDFNKIQFLMLLILFVISMMLMIFSPNLISILLGWDMLGLISYCLVIYFQNEKSYNAGMLTVLTNRIGDIFLLISISWMFNIGSWSLMNYLFIENLFMNKYLIILIILAAMTKSAQMPFSAWLPAAMAAPTPVSALVHSSTLVTAGIYLLIRFNMLFNIYNLSMILLYIGNLTMFMSSLSANLEMDLKKIIALSTLSQLGLMMSILAMNYEKLTFFHLLTHALFKALLFLCVGILIHKIQNFQDIRFSGSFINQISLILCCLMIAKLALCGMPFLTGFYSKDLILETLMMKNSKLMVFFFFFFSTGLTVSYSFRFIYNSLSMMFSGNKMLVEKISWTMMISLIFLSYMSIFSGSLLNWLILPFSMKIILPIYLKMMILLICVLGSILGYFMFNKILMIKIYFNKILYYYIYFISLMWFMIFIFSLKFNEMFLKVGNFYNKYFNFGWNELMMSFGLMKILKFLLINLMILNYKELKPLFLSMFVWMNIILLMFIIY